MVTSTDGPQAPRTVTLLGATGSIGRSTVDLLLADPDRYEVEAVVSGRDVAALANVARALRAKVAVVADPSCYGALKDALDGSGIEVAAGDEAMDDAAARPVDWTMGAVVGIAGLRPTMAAVRRGGMIALANKECLVSAGDVFMREAAEAGAEVLPVDSEHNAIAQALTSGRAGEVSKIILTASGGPFRTWSAGEIARARPENALKHPTWTMGRKVTIDSASLMNKGLELIEAHHLFGVGADQLDVLVHPQSVVHGLVSWSDGSVVAGLAPPDMRVPIAHCLGWPVRLRTNVTPLDLARVGSLTFEPVDHERFPALRLALDALSAGGAAPTVLNAANEVAVAAFLDGKLSFPGIAALVATVLEKAAGRQGLVSAPQTVEDALAIDREARHIASESLNMKLADA
ncbi:1-deoxy-D-xylulose-5-phosphate reductoisomerase [Terrihabitans rhizophilus]|uniref:1-deoxy-D-xylulose 5-phosphate reductoisomerase n=1 Tax=Terrihabitans rhizophilus TaxID=3092662 RepID=A0ABU4RKV0_9HYPH|nr:1-deoxy-D-xylulose-5-phosphate reductoisomerase [Terrihabitans sp. PJ23]MDX6805469.1 1-deoxy-D-xylulose-5-phosphate reductoisomerase [Terrihabitans sp. PJ23]